MKTPEEIESILKSELSGCDRAIESAHHMRDRIPTLVRFFHTLPSLRFCYFYHADAKIICGIETREDWAKVRALHIGKWDKTDATDYQEEKANLEYSAFVDGIHINVRVNELPPSCRVVEEIKDVPASRITIRRLVCDDPSKEHAEKGKVISEQVHPTGELQPAGIHDGGLEF